MFPSEGDTDEKSIFLDTKFANKAEKNIFWCSTTQISDKKIDLKLQICSYLDDSPSRF